MNKINSKFFGYFFPICLILILSFSRIVPHPPNFTPVLAVGIFSGFYFRNLFLGTLIVIFSMFIGDLFLGFHSTMFFTYISLTVAVVIGFLIKKLKFKEILISGVVGSLLFFLITNFGVWILSGMYENNLNGLLQSYLLAIPFFHNTLISTLIYLFVFKLFFNFTVKKKIISFPV